MDKAVFILFLCCVITVEIFGKRYTKKFNPNWKTCCKKGVMVIDLKGRGSYQGSVPGVSIPSFNQQSVSNRCSTMAMLKVSFDRLRTGHGCLRHPMCNKRMLQVDLLLHSNKKNWIFNIGDSRSNNGWGGDGATQTNDAEIQGLNKDIGYYVSDKCRRPVPKPPLQTIFRNAIGPGVNFVRLYISNEYVRIQNNLGFDEEICASCLFALSGQSEIEGRINYDIYVALNRVISGTYRKGYGVCNAIIQWTCP